VVVVLVGLLDGTVLVVVVVLVAALW